MINLGPYSGKNCPNVRFQPTVLDRILEGTALLIVLVTWIILAVYPKRRCPAARRLGDGWLFHFLFPFDGGIGVSSRPFHQFPYSGHRAQCGCSIFVCHTPYPGDEHHSVVSAFGQCLGLVLCIRQTPAPCLVCFVGGGIYRVLYTGV